MNAEFFAAIADLEKEKGIPQDYMLDRIHQALLAALKKDNPAACTFRRPLWKRLRSLPFS